jgi:hypothetical protein
LFLSPKERFMIGRILLAGSVVMLGIVGFSLDSVAATSKPAIKPIVTQPYKAKVNIMALETEYGPLIWDSKGNFAYVAIEEGEIILFKGSSLKFDYRTNSLVGTITHKRTGRVSKDILILQTGVVSIKKEFRYQLEKGIKIGMREESNEVTKFAMYKVIQKLGLTNAMSIPLNEMGGFIDSNLIK